MSTYGVTHWMSLAKKIKDNEGLIWEDAREESKKRLKVGKYAEASIYKLLMKQTDSIMTGIDELLDQESGRSRGQCLAMVSRAIANINTIISQQRPELAIDGEIETLSNGILNAVKIVKSGEYSMSTIDTIAQNAIKINNKFIKGYQQEIETMASNSPQLVHEFSNDLHIA